MYVARKLARQLQDTRRLPLRRRHWCEVDPQLLGYTRDLLRPELTLEVMDQVVLPALAERHSVHRERSAQDVGALHVPAQWDRRHVALNPSSTIGRIHPERHEIRVSRVSGPPCCIEELDPAVGARP